MYKRQVINICSSNAFLAKNFKNESSRKDLKNAVANVVGFECMMCIKKAVEQAAAPEPEYPLPEPEPIPQSNDPLADFLSKAKESGIEIQTN